VSLVNCLCCHRTAEPIVHAGTELRDDMHDRGPSPVRVSWKTCSFCNSDLVEDAALCTSCKVEPAVACDEICTDCIVAFYQANPLELDLDDDCFSWPGFKEAAARLQQVAA
jgi:hypothetical protein